MYAILMEADPGNSLGGSCIRDLWNTANYLKKNYNSIQIHIFTNKPIKERGKGKFPQCSFYIINNLTKQAKQIIDSMKKKDTLFVLFSGHGYQKRDNDGDESDGMDEYIVTNDGILVDDKIHHIFLYRSDIKVVVLTDTCHSASMMDLPYSWNGTSWKRSTNKKCSCFTLALGACLDNQLENCDVTNNIGYGGALVVHMIENDYLKTLFSNNFNEIKKVYSHIRRILSVFRQEPILQCNRKLK
jgi:hypothetical protein